MLHTLLVEYSDDSLPKLRVGKSGDWVTLYSGGTVVIEGGGFAEIPLGVKMAIPDYHEVIMVADDNLYKNHSLMSPGGLYVMSDDFETEWKFPVVGTEDTIIHPGVPICKFRLMQKQVRMDIYEKDDD